MRTADLVTLTAGSIVAQRGRSGLTALGIAVGIAAVVLLTSIGEGLHRFVVSEFTQFGTNIIAVNPGQATTFGASVGIYGTVRPLTLEDSDALAQLPGVEGAVPFSQGNAEIKANGRSRRTMVYGAGPMFPQVLKFQVASGRFLPDDDPRSARAFAVLGSRLREELFGDKNPLGERIRVGGARFRIIGVMESKGQVLGFDLDDTIYLPTARAMELFNREGVVEIDLIFSEGREAEVAEGIRRVISARHGRDDVTITTQKQMMDVLGSVLDVLTLAVGILGGISLLVGAVGILTIMTIAVTERTGEIGLLRALGAGRGQVLALFLGEAVVLATAGGLAGLGLGFGIGALLSAAVPTLPVHTPLSFVALALAMAGGIGLLAGVLPARRAAAMDPIEALRAE